jgi:phage FluMu protein Com
MVGKRRKKTMSLKEFRCKFCHRLLAKVDDGSKVEIKCPKCKTLNLYQENTVIVYEVPENNVTKKILERGVVKYDFLQN